MEIKNFQGIYLSPQQAKALLGFCNRTSPATRARLARSNSTRAWARKARCTNDSTHRRDVLRLCRQYSRRIREKLQATSLQKDPRNSDASTVEWLLHANSPPASSPGVRGSLPDFPAARPLLQLPYFWDEAGYYVAAARDLLLTGSLIPHTTVSNAHPPLVMAWVALWWKFVGFAPLVTRSAMLVVAAFSLLGVFRLAERVANTEVAIASTVCTALYPVFFAQSSLAQVDLAAAGLTFWGLCAYLEDRRSRRRSGSRWRRWRKKLRSSRPRVGLLGTSAFGCAEVGTATEDYGDTARCPERSSTARGEFCRSCFRCCRSRCGTPTTTPVPAMSFGNPEFFRYNVAATLNPLRFLLALMLRLWQVFGYMHLWLLTLGMLLAMLLPPVEDDGVERPRIAIPVQMIFLVVVAAYVVVMAIIGGAVLARYMLTAVPLVIIVAVSTLRRRLRYWPAAIAVVRSRSSRDGSGIRPTDSPRKTISPIATSSSCIRTESAFWKPAIPWRTC